jgi:hypothetical protein
MFSLKNRLKAQRVSSSDKANPKSKIYNPKLIMSLGIFSFDLAAIIDSLSNFIEFDEPESTTASGEVSLDKTEDVLQNANAAAAIIDDVLVAAALNSAVTAVITSAETAKKEIPTVKITPPPVRTPAVKLDEETRREIERLIKSLQTSVIHNYQSTDIIDEAVSLNNVANFPERKLREDSDDRREAVEQQKKREEHKLDLLREELKKAILKNNSDV